MEYISPNQVEKLSEEENLEKYLPEEVNFGFVEGISKQSLIDTRTIINNYVKDNFKSRRQSFFKITKIKKHNHIPDGYFYEIHDGGKGVSFSNLILNVFEDDDKKSVLLKIKDKYVFILRKIADIETNYMSINTITEVQKEILLDYDKQKYIDRTKKPDMEVVFSDKLTFFIISQVLLVSSLIVLGIASFFRFVYFEIEAPHQYYQDYSIMPIVEIGRLTSSENSRVKRIEYNGVIWQVEREIIGDDGEIESVYERLGDGDGNIHKLNENIKYMEGNSGN